MASGEGERLWSTSAAASERYVQARDLVNAMIGELSARLVQGTGAGGQRSAHREGPGSAELDQELRDLVAVRDTLHPDDQERVRHILQTYPDRLAAIRERG